jgi:ribonucleoside-diphosphate reductase alpha chain
MTQVHGINIDKSRDDTLTPQALTLLQDFYMIEEEQSPQEAYARAAVAYSAGDNKLAQRIYDYVSKGWFMFSSPILSNAPKPNEKHKALPISCFLSYVDDSLDGLIGHHAETAWLSVKGGGVGGHWSSVRGVTEKSVGVMPMLKVTDGQMTAYKQGKTRKGSYAAYLDIDHPDIVEFVNMKLPTGGDINRKCFNLFNAVNVTDAFMEAVVTGSTWELKDPHTKEVTDTVNAREVWQRILEARFRTGSPYINFIDTANKALPDFQKQKGLAIHGSNLCNEIHLATDEERTAVCCLSSVNLEKFDEWKESRMVSDLVTFLDNVLQEFIDNAPFQTLHRAIYSAYRERSIGIGAMGFHGYLQSKGIAWESWQAASANNKIFSIINKQAKAQTKQLAEERGECPDAEGISSVRNAHLLAIAPNANSSIICGCTASIEPLKSNMYVHRTRAGAHVIKNKYLEQVLQKYDIDNEETWDSILATDGSVQHLDSLDQDEKDTFKTAFELDQSWVVEHAAKRQPYICQGQSVNLFFPSGADKGYVNSVHLKAYREGLKGLYYLRTTAGKTADNVGQKVIRNALKDFEEDECISCQG